MQERLRPARARRDAVSAAASEVVAGGVTGLARAASLARSNPGRNVLFVAVELCTINGRIGDRRMANFIAAALFGDGAAGVLLRSLEPGEDKTGGRGTRRARKPSITGCRDCEGVKQSFD